MQITPNTVVSLNYKLSNHHTGEKIEETSVENPLVFLFGVQSMIPEFEQQIAGKIKGDKVSFSITAENAYGTYQDEQVAMIPANIFHNEDGKFDSEFFFIGATIPMSDNEGNHLRGKILEITDENVKMDFNHPLAGTDLLFDVEVLEVREATTDEIDHGHVHGEHGHHH
jgi:FKBP-type peptidyl-prolyl cis-trans isomerase SlyD